MKHKRLKRQWFEPLAVYLCMAIWAALGVTIAIICVFFFIHLMEGVIWIMT